MARVLDSRGSSRSLIWTWRDFMRVGFVLWLIPVAAVVYLDVNMARRFLEGDRRAAALRASTGRAFPSHGERTIAIIVVTHGFVIVSGFVAHYRAAARRIVVKRREKGLCECCGYDLRGIASGTDGCRVCPECGSAWAGGGQEVTPLG